MALKKSPPHPYRSTHAVLSRGSGSFFRAKRVTGFLAGTRFALPRSVAWPCDSGKLMRVRIFRCSRCGAVQRGSSSTLLRLSGAARERLAAGPGGSRSDGPRRSLTSHRCRRSLRSRLAPSLSGFCAAPCSRVANNALARAPRVCVCEKCNSELTGGALTSTALWALPFVLPWSFGSAASRQHRHLFCFFLPLGCASCLASPSVSLAKLSGRVRLAPRSGAKPQRCPSSARASDSRP